MADAQVTLHYSEPFETYCQAEAVSFHKLLAFEKSPLLYRRLYVTKEAARRKETQALRVGHAAHTLVLEGREEYERRYLLRPRTYTNAKGETKDWNGNSIVCQEWIASASRSGLGVLSEDDAALVESLALSFASNPDAVALTRKGQPEVTVRQHYESLGLSIQGRIDWLTEDWDVVDLKTILDLGDLSRDIEMRSYYRQLGFYRWLMAAESLDATGKCIIIALEKDEPRRCAVRYLSEDLLKIGEQENTITLLRLAECYRTNVWPGNPETVEIGPSARLLERTGALLADALA